MESEPNQIIEKAYNDLLKEKQKRIQFERDLLGIKKFLTAKDLVQLGIFGSKSSVWNAVRNGILKPVKISDRRYVFLREDIVNRFF